MSETLRIGGVIVSCNEGYVQEWSTSSTNIRGRRKPKGQRKQQHYEGSSSDDAALQDYLNNVEASDITGIVQYEEVKRTPFGISEGELGAGPAVEDLFPVESDGEWETGDSDQESKSGDSSLPEETTNPTALQATFPVQVKDQASGSGTFQNQPPRRGAKKLVDHALAPNSSNKPARRDVHGRKVSQKPVDNRQLKKDQVEATRTRRAADNGFDLAKVDKQLHDFVKRDGDMEAFSPMTKTSRIYLRKLAALYGLKSGEQQSRGKKRFIVVQATRKTRLPEGPTKVHISDLLEEFAKTVAPAKSAVNGSWHFGSDSQLKAEKGGEGAASQKHSEKQGGSLYKKFVASGSMTGGGEDGVVIVTSHTARNPQAALAPATAVHEQGAGCATPTAPEEQDLIGGKPVLEDCGFRGLDFDEPTTSGLGFTPSEAVELDPAVPSGEAKGAGSPIPALDAFSMLAVFEDRGPSGAVPEILPGLPSPAYEALHEYEGLQDICQPSIHQTKAQCYKANKKRAKEERRSRRQASESIEPLVQATAMNYGDFEKHTRGIGSKLMAQMGYLGEGTGLGRDKQGMAEPLQALQRPKKLGLGA